MIAKTSSVSVLILCLGLCVAYPLGGYDQINPENAEAGEDLLRVKKSSRVDDESPVPLNAAAVAEGDAEVGGATKKRSSVLLDLGGEAAPGKEGQKEEAKPPVPEPSKATGDESQQAEQSTGAGQQQPTSPASEQGPPPQDKTEFIIAVEPRRESTKTDGDGESPVLIANPLPELLKTQTQSRSGPQSKKPSGPIHHHVELAKEQVNDDANNDGEDTFITIGLEEEPIKLEKEVMAQLPGLLQMIAQSQGFQGVLSPPQQQQSSTQQQQHQSQSLPSNNDSILREILQEQTFLKQVLMNIADRQRALQDSMYRIEAHFVLN